jgi:hypothetical protein
MYEAHYLTLTAGPNQTAKEKTLSGGDIIQQFIRTFTKLPMRHIVAETFCYRRRFVKETFC